MRKAAKTNPLPTEIRIKNAAHEVFLRKGFSATTMRDVAKEAGSNLALVNYYFRSKKKLFDVVMLEKIQQILGAVTPVLNDGTTTLDQKIDEVVNLYTDFLTKNPDLPVFILSELRKNNFEFASRTDAARILPQSYFIKQLKEERADTNPLHFLLNLIGMIAFPFVAKPSFLHIGLMNEKSFQKMIQERRTLIPVWIKSMLVANAN